MKIDYKLSRIIVLGIGALFVLFGISQALFKFEVDKKIIENVSFILMMIAVLVFLNGRKNRKKPEENLEEKSQDEQK